MFDTKRCDVPVTNLWRFKKLQKSIKKSIYYDVSSMNQSDLILIRLFLVSLFIDFSFM